MNSKYIYTQGSSIHMYNYIINMNTYYYQTCSNKNISFTYC